MQKNNRDFITFTSTSHAKHFENEDEFSEKLTNAWLDDTSADSWRHNRAFEPAQLVSRFFSANWLTVGDGRWGLDSQRISKLGVRRVLPTDISDTLLKKARIIGLIEDYQVQNCEKLSFDDESFQIVFCKESVHHFPRPFSAIYEMLRVAQIGIILIEPNDPIKIMQNQRMRQSKFKFIKEILKFANLIRPTNFIRSCLSEDWNPAAWEASGNYTYSISVRDIEKLAYGLNYLGYAWKGLNDHYIEGCEFEPADEERSEQFRLINSVIKEKDARCNIGLAKPDLIMHIIFKHEFDPVLSGELIKNKWNIVNILPNPYF